MTEEDVAEIHHLEGLDQMHAVSHKIRRRVLGLLVERPMTVTQLGKELGMPPPTAHYHVRELVRVGLVRMVKARERRGILEKFYRSVARQLLLPKDLLSGLSASEQLTTVSDLMEDVSRHVSAVISSYSPDDADAVQLAVRVLFLRPGDLPVIGEKIDALLEPYLKARDASIDREHIVLNLAVPTHPRGNPIQSD
jgi:DNA-binding transcriptional ArsR family regulator